MNDNFMTPFDLVGDPISEGWVKRGRPPHQPTDDNRSKIRVLLAFGYLVPAIAKALRINKGTLRKYYLAELKYADEAMPALKGANLFAMVKSALGGNVGAQKQLQALIEKHDLAQLGAPAPAPKPPALGKKEKALQDAQELDPQGKWKDLWH